MSNPSSPGARRIFHRPRNDTLRLCCIQPPGVLAALTVLALGCSRWPGDDDEHDAAVSPAKGDEGGVLRSAAAHMSFGVRLGGGADTRENSPITWKENKKCGF